MEKAINVLLFIIGLILAVIFLIPATARSTEKRFAQAGIEYLDEQRGKALNSDLAGAARELKIIVDFWPGKVRRDGNLAEGFRKHREEVIRDVIAKMRQLSGADLGTDPQSWIKRYHSTSGAPPNEARQPTPVGRVLACSASAARRGCALRSAHTG